MAFSVDALTKCKNCIYYSGDRAAITGECRRYPPFLRHYEGGKASWTRPVVTGNDHWCGEFIKIQSPIL